MKKLFIFKKRSVWFLSAVLFLSVNLISQAQSGVRIESGSTVDRRIRIAVPPFATVDPQLQGMAAEMAQALADDLEFSGVFILLPAASYPAGFTGMSTDPSTLDLPAWRATQAENLVYGLVFYEGSQLVAQFRLFDLYSNTQLYGQEVKVAREHHRLASHRFSEEVIRQIDGTPGIGTSEIIFSGLAGANQKEIYVADYDGANVKRVTNHQSLSIMPEISPDSRSIAYLSYKDRYAFHYIFDRATGASRALSKEVGLNSAATWSPDGKRLALTLSKDGNAEIYLKNPDGSGSLRLTNNRENDTSPCFSPDGSQICFVSERAGRPKIYVMNADGSNPHRISFHGGSAYDPNWSPDGKSIAFVSNISGEGFEIYVMGADGSNPTRLTNSNGINEAPSWSPDSRHIAFSSTRNGRPELFTYTLSTRTERAIARLGMSAEGPSWGPRRR